MITVGHGTPLAVVAATRRACMNVRGLGYRVRGRVAHRSVLVVEDDPGLREIYSDVLRDEGWSVHAAEDGVQALSALRNGLQPCVALVDLRMPRMDGWTFIDELRRGPWASIPFIVLAAHFQLHEEARRIGARWWLQKPVGIDRLVETVNEACASGDSA
jgi:CheY-like chemotaxis protein